MPTPEVALVITTYQRPANLRRVLTSVAVQNLARGTFEVAVADDGSGDETEQLVREFGSSVDFPVGYTTHRHTAFHPARCRNEGAAATTAPYLVFLDGDCLIPPDHLAVHMLHRRRGCVKAGYCCFLDRETSQRVDEQAVRSGAYLNQVSTDERRSLRKLWRKSLFHNLLRHPTKPKLFSGNMGIWRDDYVRVNGFDECFEGWGCEDDDLRLRLRRAGVRIESILRHTHAYHLWHPVESTVPQSWKKGPNVKYLERPLRLTRCTQGLVKRAADDLKIRVVGRAADSARAAQALAAMGGKRVQDPSSAEIEILFYPSGGSFTGRADCNLLVVLTGHRVPRRLARRAHLIFSNEPVAKADNALSMNLDQLRSALSMIGWSRSKASKLAA